MTNTEFLRRREVAFEGLFGPASAVHHQLLPVEPHIDVYVYPAGQKRRNFCTLVTGGMSDRPMRLPSGANLRCELLLYCEEPTDHLVGLMRHLAQIPAVQQTWYTPGSTMTNGQPPQPLFEGSVLDCIWFLPPRFPAERSIGTRLELNGDPLEFLWIVPISEAECNFIRECGLSAMVDLLDEHNHPPILDPHRFSYV